MTEGKKAEPPKQEQPKQEQPPKPEQPKNLTYEEALELAKKRYEEMSQKEK
ncbi:MAG: hypothetical protein QXU98_12560 [Candidatus Parvarchaeota archaeon]